MYSQSYRRRLPQRKLPRQRKNEVMPKRTESGQHYTAKDWTRRSRRSRESTALLPRSKRISVLILTMSYLGTEFWALADQKVDGILKWLDSPKNYQDDMERLLDLKEEDTCSWVHECSNFQQWLSEHNSQISSPGPGMFGTDVFWIYVKSFPHAFTGCCSVNELFRQSRFRQICLRFINCPRFARDDSDPREYHYLLSLLPSNHRKWNQYHRLRCFPRNLISDTLQTPRKSRYHRQVCLLPDVQQRTT